MGRARHLYTSCHKYFGGDGANSPKLEILERLDKSGEWLVFHTDVKRDTSYGY